MGFACFFLKRKKSNSKKTNKDESNIITNTTTNYVYRDELDEKKPKIKKKVKFDLEPKSQPQEEAISSTFLELNKNRGTSLKKFKVDRDSDSDNDYVNNSGIKVKVLMRKEDAARLLLKCREGRVLELMDLAQEIVQVPSSSVRFLSTPSTHSVHGSLKAIPEEC